MQTNSRVINNETKKEKERKRKTRKDVSSPSYFPVKDGHRGEGYRNDVKVKKKRENGGVYTVIGLPACLLDNSFSPFDLSFAALGHFVEFGDAVTLLKSLSFARHICLFFKLGLGNMFKPNYYYEYFNCYYPK